MKARLPLAVLLGAVLTATATLSAPARADRDDHHRGYERHYRGHEAHYRGRHDWRHRDFDDRNHRRYIEIETRHVPAWRMRRFYRHAYGPHWRRAPRFYRHAGPGWYYSGSRLVIDNRSADVVRAAIAAGLIVDIINHR